MVAVLAVPLPYYSQGRSVQASLQNAGVQYRVQAFGFSRTLQQVTNELFSLDSPNLFAAQLTYVGVDLAQARPEQLLKLGEHPNLQVARITKSGIGQRITQPLTQWINLLPPHTQVTLSLYKPEKSDLHQLRSIKRTLHEILVFNDSPAAPTAIINVLECQPETVYFYDMVFPTTFGDPSEVDGQLGAQEMHVNDVRLNRCRLSGAQLVKLAEYSGCRTLNCENLMTPLSVAECEQLAALPHLESLLLGTTQLRFDQLQPLMASPKLKSFMAAAVSAVNPAELEQLRRSIPEGCNRRLRVDYRAGISVGDVGLRRGM